MEVFRKDLENAGYPAAWIKDISMDDILSTPGIKRLYTLKWCLSKFDPRIEKHLDVQDDMLEAALWVAVTKMLLISTDGKKDRDIFEGNGKHTDQIEFWKKIFHVVKLSQLNEKPHDIEPDNNIVQRIKEPLNLIPMELKMVSSDKLTSTDQLFNKQQEIGKELELLKAEKDLNPLPCNAVELSGIAEGTLNAPEYLNLEREDLQNSIANYQGIYEARLELLVDQTVTSGRPSTRSDEIFYGAATKLLSELSEVKAVHERFMKLRDEYMQFMRLKTKSMRATLENGENKLKELRMMVSAIDDLDVQ